MHLLRLMRLLLLLVWRSKARIFISFAALEAIGMISTRRCWRAFSCCLLAALRLALHHPGVAGGGLRGQRCAAAGGAAEWRECWLLRGRVGC